jgi:hypothetical protein
MELGDFPEEVSTPVGWICAECDRPIEEGDTGRVIEWETAERRRGRLPPRLLRRGDLDGNRRLTSSAGPDELWRCFRHAGASSTRTTSATGSSRALSTVAGTFVRLQDLCRVDVLVRPPPRENARRARQAASTRARGKDDPR